MPVTVEIIVQIVQESGEYNGAAHKSNYWDKQSQLVYGNVIRDEDVHVTIHAIFL